eukprot:m.136640 g.136640  ORF g.136640 m.136640 type:complete len:264 (-) comp13951_c0_seq1:109-900(-)
MADAGEDRSEVYAIYIISSLALGIIIVLYSGYRKQNKLRKLGHKWSKWMPELLKSVLHVSSEMICTDRPCSSPPPHTPPPHTHQKPLFHMRTRTVALPPCNRTPPSRGQSGLNAAIISGVAESAAVTRRMQERHAVHWEGLRARRSEQSQHSPKRNITEPTLVNDVFDEHGAIPEEEADSDSSKDGTSSPSPTVLEHGEAVYSQSDAPQQSSPSSVGPSSEALSDVREEGIELTAFSTPRPIEVRQTEAGATTEGMATAESTV